MGGGRQAEGGRQRVNWPICSFKDEDRRHQSSQVFLFMQSSAWTSEIGLWDCSGVSNKQQATSNKQQATSNKQQATSRQRTSRNEQQESSNCHPTIPACPYAEFSQGPRQTRVVSLHTGTKTTNQTDYTHTHTQKSKAKQSKAKQSKAKQSTSRQDP